MNKKNLHCICTFVCVLCVIVSLAALFIKANFFYKRTVFLNDANELKMELIWAYEDYYDASEELLNHHTTDSIKYYKAKHKIDSLYWTEL